MIEGMGDDPCGCILRLISMSECLPGVVKEMAYGEDSSMGG